MRNAETQRVLAHHLTPDRAAAVFNAGHPRLAVYSHIVLRGVTAEEMMNATRLTYAGPLQLGQDLMRFHVGDQITIEKMPPDGPLVAKP